MAGPGLQAWLQAMQAGSNQAEQMQKDEQDAQQTKLKAYLQGQQQKRDIDAAMALQRTQPAGTAIHAGDITLSPKNNELAAARMNEMHDRNTQNKAEGLSKRYEKLAGFNSALEELENKTNRDGAGGIVTNPAASFKSTGKFISILPSSAIGAAELTGLAPKGSADERKALERLQAEYNRAISGLTVTDRERALQRRAMGYMASGDPQLVAKGVRALARNIARAHKTIQAGYTPETRDMVHSVMGDPVERYNSIYNDDQPPAAPVPGVNNNNKTPTTAPNSKQEPSYKAPESPQADNSPVRPQNKASTPNAEDAKAIAWAKANPQDPRAASILQMHGMGGRNNK